MRRETREMRQDRKRSAVVNNTRTNPRIRVVVLVEVTNGATISQSGNSGIRCAELDIKRCK